VCCTAKFLGGRAGRRKPDAADGRAYCAQGISEDPFESLPPLCQDSMFGLEDAPQGHAKRRTAHEALRLPEP